MAVNESEISPHDEPPQSPEIFVASGSTCVCFKVRHHGRLLLKKQLLPALACEERRRQALEKEFEIGYALNHPNIPHYLEFHGDYLLMEYVDGVTLTDFHKQHPDYFKDKKHARQFAVEICSAVGYLHQHQVLHLDLKPDNILLTRIGNHVKLVDLGYCYQDSYPFTTGGTSHYSAPEKEISPGSDIYSLGCIFCELGIASKSIVNKCLSAETADRYQSVDELTSAMRQKHIPRKIVVPFLLALLLCAGIWWWMGRTANVAPEQSAENGMMEEPTRNEEPSDVQSVANVPTVTEPSKVDSQEQRAVSNDVERPAKTDIESEVRISEEPIDMLTRDQKKALPMFVSVTDSILAELKQFVANERMPYEMGGLEAYKAAYVSLKSRAIEYGKRGSNVPFWMRNHWMVYNGKPKPYNQFDNYLFKELESIEALFQAHVTNYNLNLDKNNDKPSEP